LHLNKFKVPAKSTDWRSMYIQGVVHDQYVFIYIRQQM